MKLAIVVGHNAHAQGAIRQDTGETEWSWNKRLAEMMHDAAPEYGIESKLFFRNPGLGGYRAEVKDVYRRVDLEGSHASIELHFNSHDNQYATGSEVLVSGSVPSRRFGKAVLRGIVETLDLKDRGTKVVTTGRGGMSLISGKAPAILVEPFFGSNAQGLSATDEAHEMEALARAYLKGAKEAFNA